jgi:DNA-binding protein HU-beta
VAVAKPLTKAELVEKVHQTSGIASRGDTEKVLDAFRDVVQAHLRKGDADVSYPGLGKFSQVSRSARTARNPRTGAAVKVKASKAPKFTASTTLKEVVKGARPAPKIGAAPAPKAAAPRAAAAKPAAKPAPRAAAAKPAAKAAAKPAAKPAARKPAAKK